MMAEQRIAAVAQQFALRGEVSAVTPYGNGHINDTYCVTYSDAGVMHRSILQRVNRHVFRDPAAVMRNIERVTTHLAAQTAGEPDCDRRMLTLIPTRDGRFWHVDAGGETWRTYRLIEGTRTLETAASADQAFAAACAFGRFQLQLATLPAPRLLETIPDFHHTPGRFAALERAIAADTCNRAALARPEIDFALVRQPIASMLLNANLPERITHNDTKLNNVLFDEATGEGICVIDLDTVMPGLAPYDFGDMVRTAANPALEDERDLTRVGMDFSLFEALLRGYLSTAGGFLTPAERQALAFAGKVITFEQGVRFLADFLAGDTYYKVHREGHNLDRCRTQFKLMESMEQQEEAVNRLVASAAR